MKCSQCGFENPGESFFCSKCGGKLPASDDVLGPTKTFYVPHIDLGIGSIFARRYQIIEELGRGGMGTVYKVLDREINEKIALKVLKPEISFDEKTIERFRNELKLARKISHQNVCRMYDIVKEEGVYFITMEYISGEDLKSTIIRLGQVTVGKTMRIVKQICKGLAEAHRLGVIHRDLKPQNIILDREGEVRIMDFGIALSRRTAGLTEPGVIPGTLEYMSPEHLAGKELDNRSDIYSLGVVMFELLTGTIPLMHRSEFAPDPRSINPQIPKDFSALILKCLEKDRNKRFSNCEEIISEISKMERGYPTTERLLPDPDKQWSAPIPKSRWPKFIVPGVFLATVIIMAGVYFFSPWFNHKKPDPIPPQPKKKGVLIISSIPQEANIWVNEVRQKENPVKLELDPGPYAIRISCPDWEEQAEEEVEVKEGQETSKPYQLRPYYYLRIESEPPEADVKIYEGTEWIFKGKTPKELTLTQSSCDLTVEKKGGWNAVKETLDLKPGRNPDKKVKLTRQQAKLSINTEPPGAQIFVDTKPWGQSPHEGSVALGYHDIRLEMPGYKPKDVLSLNVSANYSNTYPLERIRKATLILSVVPFADVSIDGQPIFPLPKEKTFEVDEGDHVIEFVSRDKTKTYRVPLYILGGKVKRVFMNIDTGESKIEEKQIL